MNIRKFLLAGLLLFTVGHACAMRSSVTINVDRYPNAAPMAPYYPVTYAPTYYPTYSYSYPSTWGYYDDYYWWDNYYDTPASTFVKTCAVMGVLALAFSLIGAIVSH